MSRCHARPLANGLSGIHWSEEGWIPAKLVLECFCRVNRREWLIWSSLWRVTAIQF